MPRVPIPPGGRGDVSTSVTFDGWAARCRWRDSRGGYHEARTSGHRTERHAQDEVLDRVAAARARHESGVGKSAEVLRREAMTVADVYTDWLAAMRRRRGWEAVRPSTIRAYREAWETALSATFGPLLINEVDQVTVMALHDGLRTRKGEPRRGKVHSAVLNQIFAWATTKRFRLDGAELAVTPASGGAPNPRALTDEEFDRLLRMAKARPGQTTATLHDFLIMARYTGARIGEILALHWSDIDFGDDDDPAAVPSAAFRATLRTGETAWLERGTATKGGDQRVVALHEHVIAMLEARHGRVGGGPTDPVFPPRQYTDEPTGKYTAPSNVRRALRDLVKDTDLAWVHPHSLRATFVTKVAEARGLTRASEAVGHSSTAVTKRHYADRDRPHVNDVRGLF